MRRWLVLLAAMLPVPTAAQTPLAPPSAPAGNTTTAAKVVLGKILFHDEQLSSNGRMACATCHQNEAGGGDARRQRNPGLDGVRFTADDTFGSPGIERLDGNVHHTADPRFGFDEQVTGRAAPSVHMAAYFDELLWDGARDQVLRDPETGTVVLAGGAALEHQSLHPFRNDVEMAHAGRSWAQIRTTVAALRPLALASALPPDVQQALATNPGYPGLFAAAFGDANVTLPRVAMALASYQRSLAPTQTPWDQFVAGQANALTAQQQLGLQVYEGDARCALCHPLGLFTDRSYRALGLLPVANDAGRGGVTGVPEDLGRFKVPSLRNVALKSTFLHTGRFTTLLQVVNFYNNGAGTHSPKDSDLQPLGLDQVEITALLDFLENGLVDARARNRLPPFDRPTLFSETQPRGSNQFGTATSFAGTAPRLLADAAPWLGNPAWPLGLVQGPANGAGALLVTLAPLPGGTPFSGTQLFVDPASLLTILPLALDATGTANAPQPLPPALEFLGLPLHLQALVAGSVPTPPWGASRAATVVLR